VIPLSFVANLVVFLVDDVASQMEVSAPISPLYLRYTSSIPPLYLHYISPISSPRRWRPPSATTPTNPDPDPNPNPDPNPDPDPDTDLDPDPDPHPHPHQVPFGHDANDVELEKI
jgi:hypothetical protein